MSYLDMLYTENDINDGENQKATPAIKEKSLGAYSQCIQNIMKSSGMRSEINKAIKNGEDAKEVLKMAIECIYLMTGDDLFRANKNKI